MTTGWLATIVSRCRGMALAAETATDGQLLARFVKEKDESAFDLLLARHAGMVWSVCRANLPNDADSEDAFQATFVALATHAKSVKNGDSLGGWLHGTALRIAGKAKRSHVRRIHRERIAGKPDMQPAAVADSAWAEWQTALHDEVRSLPTAGREAFVACVLEGQRHQDVADRLGVAVGTIAARVSRARQTILDRLTARGLAPAVAATALTFGGPAPASVPFILLDSVRSTLTVGPVPATIHALARFAGEGVTMKTKLLAATVMIGVAFTGGTVARNRAEAQAPPVATAPATVLDPYQANPVITPPAASLPRSGGMNPLALVANATGAAKSTSPRWIYTLVDKPKTVAEFGRVLGTQAANGFEYIGTETFGEQTKMVFKMTVMPTYSTKPATTATLPNTFRPNYDPNAVPLADPASRYSFPDSTSMPETPSTPIDRPKPMAVDPMLSSPLAETPKRRQMLPPPTDLDETLPPPPVTQPKPANPFTRGDTITTATVPARSPSALRELYEMESTDDVTLKIPSFAQANKVNNAVVTYMRRQPKGSELELAMSQATFSITVSLENNTLQIKGPKPIVAKVKALVTELLGDLRPAAPELLPPANPTTR